MDIGEWEGVPWGWRATLNDTHTQAARLGEALGMPRLRLLTLSHKPGGAATTPTNTHGKGQENKWGKLWFNWNLKVIWIKMIGMNKLSPMKRKLRKFHFCTSKSCQNFKVTTWMTRKEVNIEAFGPWCLALWHLHPYFEGERMDSLDITVSLGINVPSLNNSGDNSCVSTTLFEVLPGML